MCRIKISKKLTDIYFLDFCEILNSSMDEILRKREVVFDLSEVEFIDPFGMISIIGACRHLYNHSNVSSKIILPNGQAGRYMYNAGFDSLEKLDAFIEVKKPGFVFDWFKVEKESGGQLTFFEREGDIRKITQEVEQWMSDHGFNEAQRFSISTFISEMVQNVCQHSNTPQNGVLCRQRYMNKQGKSFLSWAIGDAGVGIRQSLLNANVPGIHNMSDSDAIQEVLKGRSSIQDDITRGNGFPNLFKEAQERRATLFIHSNSGVYGWNTRMNSQKKMVWDKSPISGTTVSFSLEE